MISKREAAPSSRRFIAIAAIAFGATAFAAVALSQEDNTLEQVRKYREMLEEGNPAELTQARGEQLWTTPRGPRHATFSQCDLGLGPGKLEGAYAQLPRYFADSGKVQDVESRLVTCMITQQGFSYGDATKDWYKPESDLEALVTYVASKSKGTEINVPAKLPEEAQLLAAGEAIFFRRSGPLDFSCATCHAPVRRRLRLQQAPDFLSSEEARRSLTRWPAYRVSQGAVWSMERRLMDCMRQMQWPEPSYQSDVLIALQLFLQKRASGGVMDAPGITP